MGKIKHIGGDFTTGCEYYSYAGGMFQMVYVDAEKLWPQTQKYPQAEVDISDVSEESVKKLGGAAAFGLGGAALFGPVGLLAGVLLGGNKKTHAIIAKFSDGKKAMLEMDSKLYKKLMANEMMKT